MHGFQSIYRAFLDVFGPGALSNNALGILARLHLEADPHTAIVRTSAPDLAYKTGLHVEVVRDIQQDLRAAGLVLYPTDQGPGLKPYFLTHFIIMGTPMRITRSFCELKYLAAAGEIKACRRLANCAPSA